jgi:hypothetical protein
MLIVQNTTQTRNSSSERSENVDPTYAPFAHDLNRILDEKYECFDVSPVKYTDEEGNGTLRPRKVGNAAIAEYVAFFVREKDEYREPWWREIGGQPQVSVPLPVEMFESAAGIADVAKPLVYENFEVIYREVAQAHKGEVVEGAGSKGTPKKMSGSRKKKTAE